MGHPQERETEKYTVLARDFVEGRRSAAEYESLFLSLFKSDHTIWEPSIYRTLQTMFEDVDDFVPDSVHISEVGEQELRRRVSKSLLALAEIGAADELHRSGNELNE